MAQRLSASRGRSARTRRRAGDQTSLPIAGLIASVLKRAQAEQQPVERIRKRWRELVGKGLSTHTRPVSLRRGRLIVSVAGPGDGWALSYARAQLLEKLKRRLRLQVEEIVIRPGAVDD